VETHLHLQSRDQKTVRPTGFTPPSPLTVRKSNGDDDDAASSVETDAAFTSYGASVVIFEVAKFFTVTATVTVTVALKLALNHNKI